MRLFDLSTGRPIAPLKPSHLDALERRLERDSAADTSFYVTAETIDFLRSRGDVELAEVVAAALGDAPRKPVGYGPVCRAGRIRVSGRLLALESERPLTGYKVEIYDEDVAFDDLLCWAYSDLKGRFGARIEESAFRDSPIEREPELKLRVLDVDGAALGWIGILRATESDAGDIFVSASGKVIAPILDPAAVAICPSCGALFRVASAVCNDCNVPVRPLRRRRTKTTPAASRL